MKKTEKLVAGVDLGGTFIKAGVVNSKGKIIHKTLLETRAQEGPKTVIKQIKKSLRLLINASEGLSAIGIGAPGVVQTKKGTVENPPNLPGWGTVHLGRQIEKEFGIPVFVENDANAAAVGELVFGAGKMFDSFIMVTLGTGVGGGIILNKQVFRGESGGAGELGHITIDMNGLPCNCGSIGCIEAYAGNGYLINRVKEEITAFPQSKLYTMLSDGEDLSPKLISIASGEGDEYAQKIIIRMGKEVGYAMASAANLLDIATVIVGGGVSGFGSLLFDNIKSSMQERVLKSMKPKVKVIPAKLKNEAGIKGASALAFY